MSNHQIIVHFVKFFIEFGFNFLLFVAQHSLQVPRLSQVLNCLVFLLCLPDESPVLKVGSIHLVDRVIAEFSETFFFGHLSTLSNQPGQQHFTPVFPIFGNYCESGIVVFFASCILFGFSLFNEPVNRVPDPFTQLDFFLSLGPASWLPVGLLNELHLDLFLAVKLSHRVRVDDHGESAVAFVENLHFLGSIE